MAMCARLGEKRLLLPVKCHSFDVNRQSQIHTEKKTSGRRLERHGYERLEFVLFTADRLHKKFT